MRAYATAPTASKYMLRNASSGDPIKAQQDTDHVNPLALIDFQEESDFKQFMEQVSFSAFSNIWDNQEEDDAWKDL